MAYTDSYRAYAWIVFSGVGAAIVFLTMVIFEKINYTLCTGIIHWYKGCRCKNCGKIRDEKHDWDGCVCKQCGIEDHDWVKISDAKTYVADSYESGNSYGHYEYLHKCKKCGLVEDRPG